MRAIDADHPADIIDQIDRESTIEPEYKEIDFVQQHKKLPVNLQLERKKGTWILDNSRLRGNRYICDQCGYETDTSWNPPGNYCPNCGAKMEQGAP